MNFYKDIRTWGKTTSRSRRTSTLRHGSTPTDEVELGMMPDLSQGLPNEEEMWQKMQQIRSLPITMGEKRMLKAELRVISLFYHIPFGWLCKKEL